MVVVVVVVVVRSSSSSSSFRSGGGGDGFVRAPDTKAIRVCLPVSSYTLYAIPYNLYPIPYMRSFKENSIRYARISAKYRNTYKSSEKTT